MKKILVSLLVLIIINCGGSNAISNAIDELQCECDTVESASSYSNDYEWRELSRVATYENDILASCIDVTITEWTTKDDEDRDVFRKIAIDCSIN